MAALAVGMSPLDAVRTANVAAGVAVSKHGPATALSSEELGSAPAGES
jgi:bifunctional ADP-heptose synthase (sugar kinase/adenylyltransferase)